MSYKNLEVWRMAKDVTLEVHMMSLKLPKFEQFEEAKQIRRSSKSIRSNLVEGYGRRYYKGEYMKFIIYAIASTDETLDHLEMLVETKSLIDDNLYKELSEKINRLNKKLHTFLKAVHEKHIPPKL
jgi:four helix bundle protein